MDVAFRIGNEYLELVPGTVLELEEENPFLQLGKEIVGEYTLPFTVKASEHNMRILGYPHISSIKKNTQGFEAILYSNGVQHSRGKIKIETGEGNLVQPEKGTINLYYLYGMSDFWKTIENKYLTDCTYGDDIRFPYRLSTVYVGDGFFAHVTNVINAPVGAYDYAFFPIINTEGLQRYETVGPCILNNLGTVPNAVTAPFVVPANLSIDLSWGPINLGSYRNEICPFPYTHWVLTKVFATFGWLLKGDFLEDADFQDEVLLHCSYIDWVTPSVASLDGSTQYVVWNMKNHVPQIKVSSFLIGLINRFGLWLDFDYRSKVVSIQQRKRVMDLRRKQEYTHRSGAGFNFTLNKEGKIYSIRQTGGEEKITFEPGNYKGSTTNRYTLPALSAGQENNVWFVLGENRYFRCNRDENDNLIWEPAGDNNFDYLVPGSNDDINTNCLIPGMEMDELRNNIRQTQNGRMFVAPLVTILPGEVESFYVCYNFGIVNSISSTAQTQFKMAMGSPGCHDLQGNLKKAKSLAFEYPENAATDRGIYKNEWAYFLSLLLQREEITIPIGMDLADLINMAYTDTLVIRGVEYWVKNPHFSIPLKEYSNMELVRI